MKTPWALALLLILIAPVARVDAGPLEDGIAAARNGDFAKAVRLWKPLAEAGGMAAQANLGRIYRMGLGVKPDFPQAAEWLRRAADQGSSDAQVQLGEMYFQGQGVPRDDKLAAELFRKSAEQGHPMGQFDLGAAYFGGVGLPVDLGEARRWFFRAAVQGNADAQFNLGVMFGLGQGGARSDKQAFAWYQLAAEQGQGPAQIEIGHFLRAGPNPNYVMAHMWLSLAAANPNAGDLRASAADDRAVVAQKMKPEELAEAKKLAKAWQRRPRPCGVYSLDKDIPAAEIDDHVFAVENIGEGSVTIDPPGADSIKPHASPTIFVGDAAYKYKIRLADGSAAALFLVCINH